MDRFRKPYNFSFKNHTPEEMSKLVDENFPITFPQLAKVIDRIHNRYPLISKEEISFIIREIWLTLRRFLLEGYVVNIHKNLVGFHFHPHLKKRLDKIRKVLLVKMKTPANLR